MPCWNNQHLSQVLSTEMEEQAYVQGLLYILYLLFIWKYEINHCVSRLYYTYITFEKFYVLY